MVKFSELPREMESGLGLTEMVKLGAPPSLGLRKTKK